MTDLLVAGSVAVFAAAVLVGCALLYFRPGWPAVLAFFALVGFAIASAVIVAGTVQDGAETTTMQDTPGDAGPYLPGQGLWLRMGAFLNTTAGGPPPEPATWQECADAALERAMAKARAFQDMGPMIKLNYDLAVCDRAFPEGTP